MDLFSLLHMFAGVSSIVLIWLTTFNWAGDTYDDGNNASLG